MRILYHHRTLADGAEGVHINAMVAAFRKLGHEVRVRGFGGPMAAPAERGTAARLRRVLPKPAFELAAFALNAPEYLRVRREIRAFGADLLYARHARFDSAALAAAHACGVPAILEVNALFSQGAYHACEPLAFRRCGRLVETKALSLATLVLAVSTPLAEQALALTKAATVIVMPNGADHEHFDIRLADGAAVRARHDLNDRVVVGWSGIVRAWHGLELLLQAIAPTPETHLLIVGDGPARQDVQARADSLGLHQRLTITGRVPHAAMRDYLAAMDVCVVAGEQTGVASPMKLLEYMAMSRPVVAPALPNIQDVVADGVNGLVFPPGDAAGLTSVLQRLVGEPALRQRLGAAARQTVEASRNWQAIASQALALMEARGTR